MLEVCSVTMSVVATLVGAALREGSQSPAWDRRPGNKHCRAWAVATADHVGAPPITIDGPAARAHEATPLEVYEGFTLECRQLARCTDSIAVRHISLDLDRATRSAQRRGNHYRSAVDVRRAAELYAQGRSCARSVPSWVFPGPPWVINFARAASPCVAA